jgi:hypothetical protein
MLDHINMQLMKYNNILMLKFYMYKFPCQYFFKPHIMNQKKQLYSDKMYMEHTAELTVLAK